MTKIEDLDFCIFNRGSCPNEESENFNVNGWTVAIIFLFNCSKIMISVRILLFDCFMKNLISNKKSYPQRKKKRKKERNKERNKERKVETH